MEDGINEINIDLYPKPVTIEGTKKILHQMENNISKYIKLVVQKELAFL